MVISTRDVALGTLEPSRSGREAVIAREREAVVQAVLRAIQGDVGVTETEASVGDCVGEGASIRISAQLMTLDRSEFAAYLQAHAKGYPAESLTPLLSDLARVFRR